MPDILLIQPPIHDFYLTAKRTMPYGLAIIAAALRREQFSVAILDGLATAKSRLLPWPQEFDYLAPFYGRADRSPFALFHHFRRFGYSLDHIAGQARDSGAFLVGISSLFSAYADTALQTAATVRKVLPRAVIVMGGHHPSALPEAVMQHPAVDYVLRGDGEIGLPLLARAIRRGGPTEDIPGLVRRMPEGRLLILPPAYSQNLEVLPPPALDLIDQRHYRRNGRHCLTLSATRGCPLQCTYCAVNAAGGQDLRRRSVSAVITEIDAAFSGREIGFIDFEDEHLGADRIWFKTLLDQIHHRFGRYAPELRAMNGLFAPSLDDETVHLMQQAGFKSLNLALITTCAARLRRFRRPDLGADFDRVLSSAERFGLTAVAYVIVAGPEQEAQEGVDDLLFLAARRVLAGVSVFYPAPGSRDYAWCGRQDLLPNSFGAMRATALPLVHRTDRTQAVTLLRLGRILNYMKALVDRGESLPAPATAPPRLPANADRNRIGQILLAAFLKDGAIYGIDETGHIYPHRIDPSLTRRFIAELGKLQLRGVAM
jgi:anaerobic magnesium-protoporphyrin IX monomethyl ester cyclase